MKLTTLLAVVAATLLACKKDKVEDNNSKIEIEGKVYKTVEIGNQIWMAESYSGPGGSNTSNPIKGKLYTVNEAKSVSLPVEWHLPSAEEFETLLVTIGGTPRSGGGVEGVSSVAKKLVATTGWMNFSGNNASGFNALASGYYRAGLEKDGEEFWCWTSTIRGGNEYIFHIVWDSQENEAWAALGSDEFSLYGRKMSVRFVRNK